MGTCDKQGNKDAAKNKGSGKCDGVGASCAASKDCPTKVEFKEHNTIYGFDDYTNSSVPWKSVEKGKSDTVKVKITPAGKFANVQFTSSDTAKVTVSPATAASDSQIVTVKGVANGEAEIKATCGGSVLGTMKVKTYTKKTKTVAVRLVHEKNYTSTDVSEADIESFLKKVYNQAVFEFVITKLSAKTVEFDLNKDGKFEDNNWMSTEMRTLINECKDDSYNFNIFLVNNPAYVGGTGFMRLNQKYGFVYPDNSGKPVSTLAHELGHGSFRLSHTSGDSDNIMYDYASTSKWRLRKDQWDMIHR